MKEYSKKKKEAKLTIYHIRSIQAKVQAKVKCPDVLVGSEHTSEHCSQKPSTAQNQ